MSQPFLESITSLIYFQCSPALSGQIIFTTFSSDCTTWPPPSRFFSPLSLRTCLLKIAGSNKDQSSCTFSSDLGFLCHKAWIMTEPLHARSPKAGGWGWGVVGCVPFSRLSSLFLAMWELAFDVPQCLECSYVWINCVYGSREIALCNCTNTTWCSSFHRSTICLKTSSACRRFTGLGTLYLECEYGAMVEWYWLGKTEVLGEKHYTAWVVDGWMSMEQWWNDTDRGRLKYWEKNIIQCGW